MWKPAWIYLYTVFMATFESGNKLIYLAGSRWNIDLSIVLSRYHDFLSDLTEYFRKFEFIDVISYTFEKRYDSYDCYELPSIIYSDTVFTPRSSALKCA